MILAANSRPGRSGSALLISLAVLVCVLLTSCNRQPEVIELTGATMGTSYHITAYGEAASHLEGSVLQEQVDELLDDLNQTFSTYLTDSELSRLNQAPIQHWIAVSESMMDLTETSRDIYRRSGGAFDPTVGPLVDLWGFGPAGRTEQIPSAVEIEALRSRSGMALLSIDSRKQRLMRQSAIQLDYSAIAKGYAVDQVEALLFAQGLSNLMVEIGGEIRVRGMSPRNSPWRLAVERPDGGIGQPYQAMLLSDLAVATSGDYRNYYEIEGERVSHTLDPATGRPIAHHGISVTVIASSAAEADGWATALNVLGPQTGFELAEGAQIAAFFIFIEDGEFEQRFTQAFEPYLD
ncbi:MAG: thiamine biosynthesis lipoprotein [Halieaceae bacterium]|jgi:thiamine biosynthesis lipoprotein